MTEGVAVLKALAELDGGLKFETQDYDWGSERYLRQGAMMPPDALKILETGGFQRHPASARWAIRGSPTISRFGACCCPFARALTSTSICARCACWRASLVRWPAKPPRISTSSAFARTSKANTAELADASTRELRRSRRCKTAVFTYHGTERVMRYAFEYARRHGRKKVTSATKSNAINYSMVFWDDVFREVSAKYPDIQHEQQLIDSLCARFVIKPESLDVVVASNLFRRYRYRSRRGHRRQHGAGSQRKS